MIQETRLNVKYVDEDGNEIAPARTVSGYEKDPYETEKLAIDGYEFVRNEGSPTEGIFPYIDEGILEVVYVYKKAEEPVGPVDPTDPIEPVEPGPPVEVFESKDSAKLAKTGDEVLLPVVLASMAAAGMFSLIALRKMDGR